MQLSITHGTHILEVYTNITVTTGWDAVDDRLELRSHCIRDVIVFLSASYDTTLFWEVGDRRIGQRPMG
jgi:hypothetical protein